MKCWEQRDTQDLGIQGVDVDGSGNIYVVNNNSATTSSTTCQRDSLQSVSVYVNFGTLLRTITGDFTGFPITTAVDGSASISSFAVLLLPDVLRRAVASSGWHQMGRRPYRSHRTDRVRKCPSTGRRRASRWLARARFTAEATAAARRSDASRTSYVRTKQSWYECHGNTDATAPVPAASTARASKFVPGRSDARSDGRRRDWPE